MNDLQMFRLASVFAHLTPITVAAMIADTADAQIMKYALDILIGLVGAEEAIEMLATYEIDATHPIVADAVEEWTQPDMFPAGEDAPLFTLPDDAPMAMFPDGEYHELPAPEDLPAEPVIEFNFVMMSPHNLDIVNDCIDYAWPKNTVEGCWAHLDKLLARGTISQAQYDEIKAGGDFIIVD